MSISQANHRLIILGVPVDHVDMDRAIEFVDDAVKNNKREQYILAVNPEKVLILRRDHELREMFEKASLLIPDGIGVVMAMRLLYGVPASRVPGSDLMQAICRRAAEMGHRIYIYGSREEINCVAVENLKNRYPGLNIAGRRNGYVNEEDMLGLIAEINTSGADILFIALGSPKQEQWIKKWLPHLHVKVCQGIGGTLDTIAGVVKRAPLFYQRLGLEWFYRLIIEPKRIKRQAGLPIFICKVLFAKIRLINLSFLNRLLGM